MYSVVRGCSLRKYFFPSNRGNRKDVSYKGVLVSRQGSTQRLSNMVKRNVPFYSLKQGMTKKMLENDVIRYEKTTITGKCESSFVYAIVMVFGFLLRPSSLHPRHQYAVPAICRLSTLTDATNDKDFPHLSHK